MRLPPCYADNLGVAVLTDSLMLGQYTHCGTEVWDHVLQNVDIKSTHITPKCTSQQVIRETDIVRKEGKKKILYWTMRNEASVNIHPF